MSFSKSRDEDYDDSADICRRDGEEDEQPFQAKAIFGDEHSVLTVSAMLRGEYGQRDVFIGVPCIINQNGVQKVLTLSLTDEETEKLAKSCDTLRESFQGVL